MKLIIIERDGVLNRGGPRSASGSPEWRPMAGSAAAVARLNHAGYRVAVLADSCGLARGLSDMAQINAMHSRMIEQISEAGGRVDLVVFRPTTCGSVAAAAAVVGQILERLDAPASQVQLVGDSQIDLDTAAAAGCPAVLVLTGNGRRTLDAGHLPIGTVVRVDLAAVAAELAP